VTTEEITGDFVSGFTVKNIRAVDESGERQFELDRFYFRYNGLFNVFFSKEVVIDDWTITHLFWRLPELKKHQAESRDSGSDGEESEDDSWDEVSPIDFQGAVLDRFEIKKLLFTDIHIEGPMLATPIEIKEFRITGFEAVKNRVPEIREFALKSNFLDLGLENLSFDNKEAVFVHGAFNQLFLSQFGLRKPVTFSLGVEDSLSGIKLLSVSAFDDSIQIHTKEDLSVEILFDKYSPAEFFNGADPVQELTVQIVSHSNKDEDGLFNWDSSDGEQLRLISGSFIFGQTKYDAVPGSLVLFKKKAGNRHDSDAFYLAITGKNPSNPRDVIVLVLDAETPGFIKVQEGEASNAPLDKRNVLLTDVQP